MNFQHMQFPLVSCTPKQVRNATSLQIHFQVQFDMHAAENKDYELRIIFQRFLLCQNAP